MMFRTILLAGVMMMATAAQAQSADDTLTALTDAEYSWRGAQLPPSEDRADALFHLPDVSPKAQAEKLKRWQETLAALDRIDQSALSAEQKVNYAVYRGQIEALLNEQKFRDWEKPLNSDTSFWGDLGYVARANFHSEADYRAYIAMLRDMPRYFDQNIANMKAGLKRGFTPSKITMKGRDIGVAQVAESPTPEANLFYEPFRNLPASIPAAKQAELRSEAAAAIREAVVPAHAKLLTFLRSEYEPKARTALAAVVRREALVGDIHLAKTAHVAGDVAVRVGGGRARDAAQPRDMTRCELLGLGAVGGETGCRGILPCGVQRGGLRLPVRLRRGVHGTDGGVTVHRIGAAGVTAAGHTERELLGDDGGQVRAVDGCPVQRGRLVADGIRSEQFAQLGGQRIDRGLVCDLV